MFKPSPLPLDNSPRPSYLCYASADMKKLFFAILLLSQTSWAVENRLEYMYGHGFPKSSVDFGHGSEQEGSSGSEWSADFLHSTSPHVYFGVGGGKFRSKEQSSTALIPSANSSISARMSAVLGLVRVDINANPKVITYLIGGLGWVKHSLVINSDKGTIIDVSRDAFGFAGGLGLDYLLNDRLYLGVEGRYQGSVKQSFHTTDLGQSVTGQSSISLPLSVVLVSAKIGVRY